MKAIALKCPHCGANLEIENGRNSFFCSYCGSKILLDDEKKETTINKNINISKNITKTNRNIDVAEVIKAISYFIEKNRELLATVAGLVLVFCIFFTEFWLPEIQSYMEEKKAIKEGKVSVGYSDSLEGQDYRSVVAHFESAGFTNIELIDLDDSTWKEGEVESISIAGDNYFSSDDYFDPDSKVVITYH